MPGSAVCDVLHLGQETVGALLWSRSLPQKMLHVKVRTHWTCEFLVVHILSIFKLLH